MEEDDSVAEVVMVVEVVMGCMAELGKPMINTETTKVVFSVIIINSFAMYVGKRENNQTMPKLFMACYEDATTYSGVRFLDSGCSNNMIGIKSLFNELDKTYKINLKPGDKQM